MTETPLTRHAGISVPLICGAMYPCSNPELVAAVSEAGGIGVIQPLSLTLVHKHEFRAGLRLIRSLTKKPVGLNVLTEKSLSKVYQKKMEAYVDGALEEGIRFFITALGNPRWVVERVKPSGGVVFHDVVDRRWAEKGLEAGAAGLICVNERAGGHAGKKSPEALVEELRDLGVPLVCAGGVGDEKDFARALALGVQRARRLQAGHSRGGGERHRPHRAGHRRAALRHQDAVRRARRHEGGSHRPADAPRAPDEALDSRHLLAPLRFLAEDRVAEGLPGRVYGRLLAGGKKRRDDPLDRAGGSDREALRRGAVGAAYGALNRPSAITTLNS
jgi:hypothetical protein